MTAAKPKETSVPLHPNLTATVVTFSFAAMAQSLLEDQSLMKPENLLINNNNQPIPDDVCGDIDSGEWYKSATIRLCINKEDVLCPIILFIDTTHLDKLSKWSLEPVLFTLGIFNRKTRNLSTAWRPLGLVTNTTRMSSATRAQFGKRYVKKTEPKDQIMHTYFTFTKSQNMQNYHRILKVILEDLVTCQKSGGLPTTLKIGNSTIKCCLKVPVAFVVGDCEGSDKLCGRYGTHSLGNSLICRDCDCPTKEADNPYYQCKPLTCAIFDAAIGNSDALKKLSHHSVNNAFHQVCFGGDEQGIHGCSPPEMLHLYQLGLYKYALDAFVSLLSSEQKRSFDQLVSKVSHTCYRQSDRTFPRFRFPRGITDLKKFTAAEQVGVILICFLVISTKEIESVLLCYNKSKKCYEVEKETLKRCKEFATLFEEMLITEAWINQDVHSRTNVLNQGTSKIKALMEKFKDTVDRSEGNGLKIPKFHQLLHFPRYILKFGSPNNFSTSRCESHHIKLSKDPARTAQKRDSTFEQQVGQRIVDSIVLSQATHELIPQSHATAITIPPIIGGTKFSILQLEDDGDFVAVSQTNSAALLPFDSNLLNTFGNAFIKHFKRNEGIPCFTEHNRTDLLDGSNTLFRGHPLYRGYSWNDWAFFNWANTDINLPDSHIAGQILFFLDFRDVKDHPDFESGLYAIINSMTKSPTNIPGTKILQKSNMQHGFHFNLCDVETIVDVAFVVPNAGISGEYFILRPPKQWAELE